jgi:hypothetical protein
MYDETDCLQGCLIILGKEPQVLNWAGLWAKLIKITICNNVTT